LFYRGWSARSQIYRLIVCEFRLKREQVCSHDIADMNEIASLQAVFKDTRRFIVQQPRRKDRANTCVRV
jgi:hypothetical protein